MDHVFEGAAELAARLRMRRDGGGAPAKQPGDVDVPITGAGVPGIGAGATLQRPCTDKRYLIPKPRVAIGGTRLRYPANFPIPARTCPATAFAHGLSTAPRRDWLRAAPAIRRRRIDDGVLRFGRAVPPTSTKAVIR